MRSDAEGVPRCSCGGTIKPDVVLYEEGLDNGILSEAVRCISEADVLIIGGTSLVVYPAAGLVNYYNGHKLVVINKSPTPMTARLIWLLQAASGKCWEISDCNC